MTLNMKGPYDLNENAINGIIPPKRIGNYALGYMKDKTFFVKYVGRSDNDLKSRLISHCKENYKSFKYSTCISPKNAFEEECRNWHDFGGDKERLDNKIHPDRPDGTNYKCPFCNHFS